MKIVIINGYPNSGKTTFIDYLIKKYSNVVNISSVDYVKNFAQYKLNWNGEKTLRARKMLSELKKLLEEWDNSPTNDIMSKLFDIQKKDYLKETETVIFIDVREPEEIKRLKTLFLNYFGNNIYTLFINRMEVKDKTQSNLSDSNVENYDYDFIIDNNETLKELYQKADYFYNYNI